MASHSLHNDEESYEELKNKIVVRIPYDKVLTFPDLCVKCGGNLPDSIFIVKNSSRFSKFALFGLYSEKENFPSHKNCASALKVRQISLFLTFLILFGFFEYIIPDGYPTRTSLLLMVPIIVGYAIWQEIHPPPVSLSTARGLKIFEFKNKEYGNEFANVNDAL